MEALVADDLAGQRFRCLVGLPFFGDSRHADGMGSIFTLDTWQLAWYVPLGRRRWPFLISGG